MLKAIETSENNKEMSLALQINSTPIKLRETAAAMKRYSAGTTLKP